MTNQMTYGQLFGGDSGPLPGGFVDTIKGKLSGVKDFTLVEKVEKVTQF